MDKEFIGNIYAIVGGITLIFIIAILLISFFDTKSWNDGHCKCGGNWVYEQAVGHHYYTTYMYTCDKCGKAIEITDKR